MSEARSRPLDVLVVDDSAVVRQAFTQLLGGTRGMSVRTAPHPLLAREKIRSARPDVIVLDLELPHVDGLTFLREIMADDPIPVVVCSALSGPGTAVALAALEEGAVEVLSKPRLGVRDHLADAAGLLIDTVRAAAQARLQHRAPRAAVPRLTADAVLPPASSRPLRVTTDKVVVMGASTGGTEALRGILRALPPTAPGLVIVQHMPANFTRAFAERLDCECALEVKEAVAGDRVCDGRALLAPGGRHTLLLRNGAHYAVDVVDGPPVARHRPSVDVLFRSAAAAAGSNAVGVILTGMGDDGAAGLAEMKRRGAATVAQDEATSVVFGMPKEAIARGAVDEVLPLGRIPGALLRLARRDAAVARA